MPGREVTCIHVLSDNLYTVTVSGDGGGVLFFICVCGYAVCRCSVHPLCFYSFSFLFILFFLCVFRLSSFFIFLIFLFLLVPLVLDGFDFDHLIHSGQKWRHQYSLHYYRYSTFRGACPSANQLTTSSRAFSFLRRRESIALQSGRSELQGSWYPP